MRTKWFCARRLRSHNYKVHEERGGGNDERCVATVKQGSSTLTSLHHVCVEGWREGGIVIDALT